MFHQFAMKSRMQPLFRSPLYTPSLRELGRSKSCRLKNWKHCYRKVNLMSYISDFVQSSWINSCYKLMQRIDLCFVSLPSSKKNKQMLRNYNVSCNIFDTGQIHPLYLCTLYTVVVYWSFFIISFQMNFLVRVLYYNETWQDGCTSLCNNTKLKYHPSL